MHILWAALLFLSFGSKQSVDPLKPLISDPFVLYQVGFVAEEKTVRFQDEKYTVLSLIPYATKSPKPRVLVFCGDRSNLFVDKGFLLVVSYDAAGHEGGCFDLLGVNTVIPPTELNFKVSAPGTISLP